MKLKRRRQQQQRWWQTCCKMSQYWTSAVLRCSIWVFTKFQRADAWFFISDLKKKKKKTSSKQNVSAVWRVQIWFHSLDPAGCVYCRSLSSSDHNTAQRHALFSLSLCSGAFPTPWGAPPALPWVYPSCHGNTLQSHRPKYPKLRIISWQDVSERVPYRTRRVSAVSAMAAPPRSPPQIEKVWLLTLKSGWILDSALCCHTHRRQSSSELYTKPICNLFS